MSLPSFIPEKCMTCRHAVTSFEQVHDGYCKFHLDYVTRCHCSNVTYVVGCPAAEAACRKSDDGIGDDEDV